MGARVAFLIGNQAFDETVSGLKSLRGPRNDVAALQELLAAEDRGGFAVQTFLDATSGQILEALDAAVGSATRNDLLLIFYAGHGKWSRAGLCLATANTVDGREQSTAIPVEQLASVLKHCQGAVVLLLDCCYSAQAAEYFRGDAGSALAALAEQVGGLFLLASSSSSEVSKEVEEDGVVLGSFTATIRRGLLRGEAAGQGEDSVRFSSLRAWVERELRGQSPRHATGRGAQGDPVIALVPRGGRDHRRLSKLSEFLAAKSISAKEFAEMCAALEAPAATDAAAVLRDVLDVPEVTAQAVVLAWRAAHAPKREPRKEAAPKVEDEQKDRQSQGRPRSELGWQLLPLSLISGLPAGLIMANTQVAMPEDVPFIVGICSAAVFVASLLARFTTAWTYEQAAIRLAVVLVALFAGASLAVQDAGSAFVAVFPLFGMIAGLAAWRLLALPIARGADRPLAGFIPGAIAAGIGTVLLLFGANGLFGAGPGRGIARYSSEVPGAIASAALAAIGVVCALCLTAALRRSRKQPAAPAKARDS